MTWNGCEPLASRFVPDAPAGAVVIETGDVDLGALATALAPFGIELPRLVAVAVQDHGFRPGAGNNEVRFEYLQGLLAGGGDLRRMVYTEPPAGMTRMEAVRRSTPGAYLMDTGAAAVLGALGDPVVAEAASSDGAILVNVGNMHTFATLLKGRRLFGLFEHHTGGITPEIIAALVARLRDATLDTERFRETFDGHGAALDPAYREVGPFTIRGGHRSEPAARAWSRLSRGGATRRHDARRGLGSRRGRAAAGGGTESASMSLNA